MITSIVVILLSGVAFGYGIYKKLDARGNLFNYDLSTQPDRAGTEDNNWNPLNIRLAISEISTKVIKDHWLLGVGPSNMRDIMDSYYTKYNFVFGMNNHLHPHNQYIHSFIVLGIGGLIVLVLFTFSAYRISVRRKDKLLGSLTILFLLFSLTDSTLSVNKGIMFFSFFFSFLTYIRPSSILALTGSDQTTTGTD